MKPYDSCLEKDAGFLTEGDVAKTYINWSGGKDSAFALYLI
jgi:diphthamide synthase (EF-2-diphthine--ammonia ligase)